LKSKTAKETEEMKMTKAMTKLMRANRLMRDAVRELAAESAALQTRLDEFEGRLVSGLTEMVVAEHDEGGAA
jgi:predicted RNase H-like nuclease (RuvC/YqgF family)